MIVIDSLFDKNRDGLVLENIETRLGSIERKSLNTDPSIATEEVFYVAATAPCVIAANVTVVRAEHGTAFTGALYNVNQRRIRRELGVRECIGTKEVHIPFAIAIPFGTWRRSNLLHFFRCILISARNLTEVTEPTGHRRFCFRAFAAEEPRKSHKNIG